MEEETTTTTIVPMEQQTTSSPAPTNRRRFVIVGIVLTTAGILYVLYRLWTPTPLVVPQKVITIQKNMQKQQIRKIPIAKSPINYQVFRQSIQQQRRKLREISR